MRRMIVPTAFRKVIEGRKERMRVMSDEMVARMDMMDMMDSI